MGGQLTPFAPMYGRPCACVVNAASIGLTGNKAEQVAAELTAKGRTSQKKNKWRRSTAGCVCRLTSASSYTKLIFLH